MRPTVETDERDVLPNIQKIYLPEAFLSPRGKKRKDVINIALFGIRKRDIIR